ncbi:MAG: VWA domain-containing protein [Polyangiaceae bacterium]|nr:VWA domain-containing protein [Polyangiaceae bacterium]
MSIDEAIFGWLSRAVTKLTARESAAVQAAAVEVEPLLPRLRVLAGAAAGRPLELRLVDDAGAVSGEVVMLPRRVTALGSAEENERLLLVRATLAGAMVRVASAPGSSSTLGALTAEAEALLLEELPGWASMRAALPATLSLESLVGRLLPRPAPSLHDVRPSDAEQLPSQVTTERDARRRAPPLREKRLLEERGQDNPLTHSFEKVHTAEEHKGGSKRADGGDELADHLAALDELDLEEVVVSGERTRSIYRADASLSGEVTGGEASGAGLRYDEWDPKHRRYLARHCAVTVEHPPADAAEGRALRARVTSEERRALAETRAELFRLDTAMRWHTRQPDGPDVDLDALVDRATALRSGHEGPSRLYVSRRRRGHSVALMLLVDASMSTDGWVGNRRVLDLERDATALVSIACEDIVDELALGAFCSFSRQDCRFTVLKSFEDPLVRGLARLARLEARGYTRVGPALRHATAALARTTSRRKALLVLSDGKPSDTDRYEGRHGIGDVRQAVREARQRGVEVFALSADPRSKALLPEMFGARGHAGLSTPGDVGRAVGQLVAQLLA